MLPTLAVVGFAIFATEVTFEAAFHVGVTSWAVGLLKDGREVPELYGHLPERAPRHPGSVCPGAVGCRP